MTKAIEDAANALAIRTALGVPTNAELAAVSDVADAAYVKPVDGIPHNDLHTGIRDQLDLADTALQPGVLPVGTTVTAAQISDAGAAGRTLLQKATFPEIQSLVSGAAITAKAKALRKFHAALALRDTAPCNLLHVGNSITWGYLSGAKAARWPDILRNRMRQKFPQSPAGGIGFMSVSDTFGSTFSDANVVRVGGSVASGNFGPDTIGFVLSATGNSATYTFTGTGCDIGYATYSGGGTISYAVDGGAPSNISTNVGSVIVASNWNTTVRGLAAGTHTVVISWVSGTSYLAGVFAYNGDETKGIRSWVAAVPGSTSAVWWNTAKNQWWDHVPKIAPALVTIELGANDYGSASKVPVATYKANLKSIIALIKTKCGYSPSFVLIPVWPLVPSGGAAIDTWANYVNAMSEIASEDTDGAVYVHNWMDRTFSTQGDTMGGLMPDTAHPGPALNGVLAEMLLADISPA